MFEIRLNPDETVEIPQIGIMYLYEGNEYECIRTRTHQEQSTEIGQSPWKPTFTTYACILRVDDNGDDAGEPSIWVNSDKLTEI